MLLSNVGVDKDRSLQFHTTYFILLPRKPCMTKGITRFQLYDGVHRKVGLSRTESAALTERVIKEISDALARGELLKLSRFGAFIVRRKDRRLSGNPKTGVEVPIAPRSLIVFKASAIMKIRINGVRPVPAQCDTLNKIDRHPTNSLTTLIGDQNCKIPPS